MRCGHVQHKDTKAQRHIRHTAYSAAGGERGGLLGMVG